jgi:CheY-like chemotaxis protein
MSSAATPTTPSGLTVYFIDDSATMREVIKIAFRKENINVIACHNAAAALDQFNENRPDAVITDVIMPDKDGFEVCQFIKSHPEFGATPVILMSGVVNRHVAERALAVKADDLIRKPFQPNDLIARVKALLKPKTESSPSSAPNNAPANAAAIALGNLFASAASGPLPPAPVATPAVAANPTPPRPLAAATATPPASASAPAGISASAELQKLRNEVRRLELLIKKLQSELEAERQYSAELESQLRVQQETP